MLFWTAIMTSMATRACVPHSLPLLYWLQYYLLCLVFLLVSPLIPAPRGLYQNSLFVSLLLLLLVAVAAAKETGAARKRRRKAAATATTTTVAMRVAVPLPLVFFCFCGN